MAVPFVRSNINVDSFHTGAPAVPVRLPGAVIEEAEEVLPAREIVQHAYDINIEDDFEQSNQAHIHLWCLDKNSQPSLIRIRDFPVFCYAQLPDFVDSQPAEWNETSVGRVFIGLQAILKGDKPTGFTFACKKTIYYYQDERTHPMILLRFPTIKAMREAARKSAYAFNIHGVGQVRIEMLENTISIVRKLFTLRKVGFAQWFSIMGKEVLNDSDIRISKPGTVQRPVREYIADWKTMTALDNSLTKGWMSSPRIMAFDIETYSDNHRAFPCMYTAKHKVYLNSCIYQELGKPETRHQTLFVLGPPMIIPGATVVSCSSEEDLVEKMGELVNRLDPEIISGYNILAYDYPYLAARIGATMTPWPRMSRLLERDIHIKSKSWKSGAYGRNESHDLVMPGRVNVDMLPIIRRDYGTLDKYDLDFVSKMFLKKGKHDIKASRMFEIYEALEKATTELETNGEVPFLRLPPVISLPSPPPDELLLPSSIPGDEERKEEAPTSLQLNYEAALADMAKVGAYCLQDSALVVDLFVILHTWVSLVEMSSIFGVTMVELFTAGQQIRTLSQLYNISSTRGYVINKRVVGRMHYSGGAVYDPIPGVYKADCFDFKSLYPSIMRAYNICYTTLVPKEFDSSIPDSKCNICEFTQDEPIGGPSGKSGGGDSDAEENDFFDAGGVETDEEDEDKPANIRRVKYRFRFIKKEYRLGILPDLVEKLVNERDAVKDQQKVLMADRELFLKWEKLDVEPEGFAAKSNGLSFEEWEATLDTILDSNNLIWTILEKRQNALKVAANSTYGFIGVQNGGALPCIEGALSTTAMGRGLIGAVNKYCETKYKGTVVYGDTDSSMVDFHIDNIWDRIALCQKIALEISGSPAKKLPDGTIIAAAIPGLFPPPLSIEYEKSMLILCIKKKKYAYYEIKPKTGQYERDRMTGEILIKKKGIAIARRDNCKYFKDTYVKVLRSILDGDGIKTTFRHITEACCKLLRHQIPVKEKLTIIRGLGEKYKQANYFMKIFSEELKRMGRAATVGDRISYVVVKTQEELQGLEVKLGRKMREISMYEESQELFGGELPVFKEGAKPADYSSIYMAEDIDAVYYIGHVFCNAIDQLFSIGYIKELKKYENLGYQPTYSRCHFGSFKEPITMIVKLIEDNLKNFSQYQAPEKEKLAVIADIIEQLATWVETNIDQIDSTSPPPTPARVVGRLMLS
jgi:DNA polymerase elongation subunit (family B)